MTMRKRDISAFQDTMETFAQNVSNQTFQIAMVPSRKFNFKDLEIINALNVLKTG